MTLAPHPLPVPRSKIEYSYTSSLPKGLRGLRQGESYLLQDLSSHSYDHTVTNAHGSDTVDVSSRSSGATQRQQWCTAGCGRGGRLHANRTGETRHKLRRAVATLKVALGRAPSTSWFSPLSRPYYSTNAPYWYFHSSTPNVI